MTLSDGTKICGQVHESLRVHENHRLVEKCLDLESAYRQLPVKLAHAHLAIFALKNPTTGEVEYFEANALPFGASAAVHGFNRAVSALEHILQEIFVIPCAHYFDDFIFIMPAAFARQVTEGAKMVLDFLGWSVKTEKEKDVYPAFDALGVRFDPIGATVEKRFLVVSN